uniref:Uncharacterized protein n=1 Tax=Anguilla anguilla TaxID=7936 RepID=A0A0E9TGS7_ANGAN
MGQKGKNVQQKMGEKSTTQNGSSAPEGQMTLCFTKMRAICVHVPGWE